MRRKIAPKRYNYAKKSSPNLRNCEVADGAYVLSRRAQAVLSAILEGILEESLEDAKNLAMMAGKNCVTRDEVEKALKKLCLRLNDQFVATKKSRLDSFVMQDESSD
ncbi:hypothetical protein KPH14_003747 [Odynerus spinipes]|uniref:Uncharacterized protein n=1 Tax=Odynerus spinipes TaxID=1348599 RepID=A0AAD9RX82_9HYME|nr:hypothetical protein KPH14_003747 [Odynerus spinipes]